MPKTYYEWEMIANNSDFSHRTILYTEEELQEALIKRTKMTVDKSAEKDVREFFKEEIDKALKRQAEENKNKINLFFSNYDNCDLITCGCGCNQELDIPHGVLERIRIELQKYLGEK